MRRVRVGDVVVPRTECLPPWLPFLRGTVVAVGPPNKLSTYDVAVRDARGNVFVCTNQEVTRPWA